MQNENYKCFTLYFHPTKIGFQQSDVRESVFDYELLQGIASGCLAGHRKVIQTNCFRLDTRWPNCQLTVTFETNNSLVRHAHRCITAIARLL